MVVMKQAAVSRLYPLIRQVLTKVGTHRTITGSELNLTSLQTEALGVVDRNNNLTMGEFAKGIMIVQSSATRIADDLVKRGLLTRTNDRGDRRINRLKITQKGQRALEKVRTEGYFLLEQVLEKMTPQEQEGLIRGLESFVNAVTTTEREVLLRCEQEECKELVKD